MKKLLTILSLILFANSAYSAETIGEKTNASVNDAKREVKKTAHRGEEKMCEKTDKNCFAKKASHRTSEAADYAKDKAKERTNMIDNN